PSGSPSCARRSIMARLSTSPGPARRTSGAWWRRCGRRWRSLPRRDSPGGGGDHTVHLKHIAAGSDPRPMRSCPKCKMPTLTALAPDRVTDPDVVPPSRCATCRGVWLPHDAIEQHVVPPSADVDTPAPVADGLPGFCLGCRGLLVRARL